MNIVGTRHKDYIAGENGADTIAGKRGDDVLLGRDGNDEIHGGRGRDWMDGGDGTDALYGGKGSDTFFVTSGSLDAIMDFEVGKDKIVLDDPLTTPNPSGSIPLPSSDYGTRVTYSDNGVVSLDGAAFVAVGHGLALSANDFYLL